MGIIKRIAILGAGRYSELLLDVMASEEEKARGVEVVATHRRAERRAEVSERFGIRVLASNREACEGADMIIPLVRPEQMAALMEEVGPVIGEGQIVATGAASIPLSWYRQFLKVSLHPGMGVYPGVHGEWRGLYRHDIRAWDSGETR